MRLLNCSNYLINSIFTTRCLKHRMSPSSSKPANNTINTYAMKSVTSGIFSVTQCCFFPAETWALRQLTLRGYSALPSKIPCIQLRVEESGSLSDVVASADGLLHAPGIIGNFRGAGFAMRMCESAIRCCHIGSSRLK